MFKKPRKTCHSDARYTYEYIHDTIMSRLQDSEKSNYLCDIMPLLERVQDLSLMETRKQFFCLAQPWMTADEKKIFHRGRQSSRYIGPQLV